MLEFNQGKRESIYISIEIFTTIMNTNEKRQ